MFEIAEYKEVRQFGINFKGGTTFSHTNIGKANYKGMQGRMAILNVDNSDGNIRVALQGSMTEDEMLINSQKLFGKNLFVSKKSKVSRDVLRNTYKIKLDPAAADYVVFPTLKDIYHYYAQIYGMDDKGVLWMSWLMNLPDYDPKIDYLYQGAVTEFCKTSGVKPEDVHHDENFEYVEVPFIPVCEEYKEMLLDKHPDRIYIADSTVPFEPLNKITPQTLKIWSHIEEMNVLEKLIVGSDWQKYPTTLALFLKAEQEDFESECGQQGKLVLDGIKYWDHLGPKYRQHRRIEPEDWNMLQSYIFYLMGLDGTKAAYVNIYQYNNLPKEYRPFVKCAHAVQPVLIESSKDLLELYQAIS